MDWRGFELHPETPPGGVELAQYFGAGRVGRDPDEAAAAMTDRSAPWSERRGGGEA